MNESRMMRQSDVYVLFNVESFEAKLYRIYVYCMVIFSIALTIVSLIGKGALDVYPLFMVGWTITNIILPRKATTPLRLALVLVVFTVFDGLIDSLSHHGTGNFKWLPPPYLIGWNFTLYPNTTLLFKLYMLLLWGLILWFRSYMTAYILVRHYRSNTFIPELKYENIMLTFAGIMFLWTSMLSDWINFLVRPMIPPIFTNYVFPYGFWSVPYMAIRTILVAACGFAIFFWVFRFRWRNRFVIGMLVAIACTTGALITSYFT
jgi:hypothetical protein